MLDGGAGSDTLSGGNGDDLFVYSGGQDFILDFKPGGDQLDLSAYLDSFEDLLAIAQEGPDGVILGDGSDLILLKGVALSSLSAGDFLFG